MRRPIRLTASVLGLILLTSACSGGSDHGPEPLASPSPRPIETVNSYVALGDSYTAGPGIAPTIKSSSGCLRSKRNWPSLLADELKAKDFTDVSCTGAPTAHLTEPFTPRRGTSTPPQLDAVRKSTELITMSLGGNDSGTFPGILAACTNLFNKSEDVCTEFVGRRLGGMLEEVHDGVERGLMDVRRQAPEATVLLVGYLRASPDKNGCKQLGTTGKRAAKQARAEKQLDQTLAKAAKKAGVSYLSLYRLSKGHDVCAGDDAWVNGLTQDAEGDGVALHPNEAGMKAAASAVAEELERAEPAS